MEVIVIKILEQFEEFKQQELYTKFVIAPTNITINTALEDQLNKFFAFVHRHPQAEELIKWLESIGYFNSPASANHHCNYKHGLLFHSVNVACLYEPGDSEGQLAALLHDVCKCGSYQIEEPLTSKQKYKAEQEISKLTAGGRNSGKELSLKAKKLLSRVGKTSGILLIDALVNKNYTELDNINAPMYQKKYTTDSLGHGEASVIMVLQAGFDLSKDQILAIRYHMKSFDPGYQQNQRTIENIFKKSKMTKTLHIADYVSTNMWEE